MIFEQLSTFSFLSRMYVHVAGFVQFLQYYYQSGCLYRLRALGERNQLDLTVGEFYISISTHDTLTVMFCHCNTGCEQKVCPKSHDYA